MSVKAVRARRDRAAEPHTPSEGTIRSLILRYQASPDWTKLKPYTREIEQYHIDAIEDEFGDMALSAVEERGARASFLEWRDEIAEERPAAADAKIKRFARILKFGLDLEIILRHPLAGIKRVHKTDRSEVIWLPAHFKKLAVSAPKEVMLGSFVALHTGQRRGDLLALRWRQYDGGRIRITQQKTGARVDFPCTRALKATLDALRAERQPEPGDAVLLSPAGAAWKMEAWKSAWRRAVLDAELPPVTIERDDGTSTTFDLHFHDIRGTAVTMLAEAGCTIPEITAITGHALEGATRILERYLNRTRVLADAAMAKFELKLAETPIGEFFHGLSPERN